jgi:AraC-like DNA-binding protein
MPSSAVRTFSDPDDYAACIRNSTAEMTITGRGVFSAKLTRIDLHSLWMQRLSDNLPRIAHLGAMERPAVTFRTRPGPSLLRGGVEVSPTHIVRHTENESGFQHSSGLADWAAMSLPIEDMVSVGAAIADLDLTPPKDPTLVAPSPAAMAKLQGLHAAASRLAEEAPDIIAHPEAARGLEQALIEAMVGCLANREGRANSLAQGQHAIVMRRFRRVVEENPEEPLYIPDICKTIGISPRALLVSCQEHFGMGPKRYLLLRRMHLVRRALRQATPGTTSVTEMAMRYGFWQLGRFAVKYHSLFGEVPSATLRRESA